MPNEDRPDSRPAGSHPPARRPAGAVAPPDGRTRYANGERRRAAIVDEAMTVFATRGFHNLSMRQIAEAVGVSLGILLARHFDTLQFDNGPHSITRVALHYMFAGLEGLKSGRFLNSEQNDRPNQRR